MNFRGERRSNDAHASTTDPMSVRQDQGRSQALLSGDILVENRNGLIADCELSDRAEPPPPCSGGNAPGGKGKMAVACANTRLRGRGRAVKSAHVAKKQRRNYRRPHHATRATRYQRRRKVVENPSVG